MSDILLPALRRFQILGILLVMTGLLSACGGPKADEEAPDPEFIALQQQMEHLTDHLIAESLRMTVEEPFAFHDGRPGVRRVRLEQVATFPSADWTPPIVTVAETAGVQVTELPLERRPWAVLVDNTGNCVVAKADRVEIHFAAGGSAELDVPRVQGLQWNHDASAFLVDATDAKRWIEWPTRRETRDLLAEGFRGRLMFAPNGKSIWQVVDLIDPDASSEVRVLLASVRARVPGETAEVDVISSPTAMATLGTFPNLGEVWGHRIRAGMILPRPAPIWLLGEDMRPSVQVSEPGDKVDLFPSASDEGRVVFLRTRRVIDGDDGLRLAVNTRAWQSSIHQRDAEFALTSEPTYGVAVSPDGGHLALIVERTGRIVLLRSTVDQMGHESALRANGGMEAFERQVQRVLVRVTQAWSTTPWHPIVQADTVSYDQPLPGAEEVMATMATALEEALAEEHGLVLGTGREAITLLDRWMMHSDGLLSEDNATVVAVSALYGTLLTQEDGIEWEFSSITPAFSNDLQEASVAYKDLARLHSPFYAAREAISGRLSLVTAATDALGREDVPVGLVENFSDRTGAAFAVAEVRRSGVEVEAHVPIDVWKRIVEEQPHDVIANEAAWSAGTARQEGGVAFAAAMNLAEADPTNPRRLIRFARELVLAGLDDAALRLYDHAEVLAPDDPEVRLEVANAYFGLYRYDEAELLFLRILDHFPSELETVVQNLEVLRSLRDNPGETED
jgi:tetratricopeptide (TPR) repeat protein